jgi:putative ABC transport system permease protein
MIRHVFKLIWNRKRRNFLLMSEMFFSFVVLFAVAAMVSSSTIKYIKPLGFSYENVWVLQPGWRALGEEASDSSVRAVMAQIQREMEAYSEIRKVSWLSGNFPYSSSRWSVHFEWDGRTRVADYTAADDDFAAVLDIPVVEGRWFSREDDASSITPVVLNGRLKQDLVGDEPAVGIVQTSDSEEYKVVGVIDEYRFRGEFEKHRAGFFERSTIADTASNLPECAVFSVREGVGVDFEERLAKHLSSLAPGWSLRIETMESARVSYIKEHLMALILNGIVAGFLVFNVALGLFGVLWYSINRRRGEIGLRRAVGADASQISRQVLCEALVMATFAIIAGVFIAAQAPILSIGNSVGGAVYVFAMACSAGMIYLIVLLCALYPSWLASRIQPAEALHYE